MKLDGGAEYYLDIYREIKIDSRIEAEKACQSISIEKGDLISLGKNTYDPDCYPKLALKVCSLVPDA